MELAAQYFFRQSFQSFGWRRFIDKMKPSLTGLGHDALHAIDQGHGRGCFVAGDVVQAHIAKAAFFPVAPVRHGEFVPAPIAPQTVHGVEHVEQRQITV